MLLKRHPSLSDSRSGWFLAHAGRLTSYALLGALIGGVGDYLGDRLRALQEAQGLVAFLMAAIAMYFVFTLLGWLPSPDLALSGLTRRWGLLMRTATGSGESGNSPLTPLGLGLLWGFLPCGLVLTALFTAVVSTSPLAGAGRMLAFGAGTIPALLGIRWLAGKGSMHTWPRYGAALAMLLFGVQFTLRGLASWGLVEHLMIGKVMLW